MLHPGILTLTTDFGGDGPYVAAMKGVILSQAPRTQMVDVTHAISPQNVLEGAYVMGAIVATFPEGTVHLGVVDPGVGTDRRLIAASVAGQWFVVPDNGLLSGVTRTQAARCPLRDCQSATATAHRLHDVSRPRHPRPRGGAFAQWGRSGRTWAASGRLYPLAQFPTHRGRRGSRRRSDFSRHIRQSDHQHSRRSAHRRAAGRLERRDLRGARSGPDENVRRKPERRASRARRQHRLAGSRGRQWRRRTPTRRVPRYNGSGPQGQRTLMNSSKPPSPTTDQLRDWDRAHLWHPFTPQTDWNAGIPLVIKRAEGVYLVDSEGNRYLDGVSSLWCNVPWPSASDARRRDPEPTGESRAHDPPRRDAPDGRRAGAPGWWSWLRAA